MALIMLLGLLAVGYWVVGVLLGIMGIALVGHPWNIFPS